MRQYREEGAACPSQENGLAPAPAAVTLLLNCPTRQRVLSPDGRKDKGCIEHPSVRSISLPCKQEAGSFTTVCHRFGLCNFFFFFLINPHVNPSMTDCCTGQKTMRLCAWLHELVCASTCLFLTYSSEIQGWDTDKNCLY